MRLSRAAFLGAGASLLLATPALAGKTLKLKTKPLQVGDSGVATEVITMDVALSMQMGADTTMDGRLQAVHTVERHFEVVATGTTGPIHLRVTYVQASEKQTIFGQTEDTRLPVAGATYDVFIGEDDSVTRVERAGQPPTPAALEFLHDDIDFVVDAGLTDRVQGVQKLQIGQGLPDTGALASAVPGMDPATARFEATVAGKERFEGARVGRVDLVFVGDIQQGPMRIRFDGGGDILLDLKRGYLRRTHIEGPLELSGAQVVENGMTVEFTGKGTMTMDQQTTLE